jgi:hypothetical protein
MIDPKSANEYDDRGARAVYSVLLEIGQVLGAYRDRFVVIGGSVPWLLFPDAEPAHVGTLDIDPIFLSPRVATWRKRRLGAGLRWTRGGTRWVSANWRRPAR